MATPPECQVLGEEERRKEGGKEGKMVPGCRSFQPKGKVALCTSNCSRRWLSPVSVSEEQMTCSGDIRMANLFLTGGEVKRHGFSCLDYIWGGGNWQRKDVPMKGRCMGCAKEGHHREHACLGSCD